MTNVQPPAWNQPQRPPGPSYDYRQQPPTPQRRKPRVFMWVILAINALFAWWLIAGVGGGTEQCAGLTGSELDACQSGAALGTGIAALMIIGLWAFVDIILGVIYLVTRKR